MVLNFFSSFYDYILKNTSLSSLINKLLVIGRKQPQRQPVAVRVAWDLHRVHRRSS